MIIPSLSYNNDGLVLVIQCSSYVIGAVASVFKGKRTSDIDIIFRVHLDRASNAQIPKRRMKKEWQTDSAVDDLYDTHLLVSHEALGYEHFADT